MLGSLAVSQNSQLGPFCPWESESMGVGLRLYGVGAATQVDCGVEVWEGATLVSQKSDFWAEDRSVSC